MEARWIAGRAPYHSASTGIACCQRLVLQFQEPACVEEQTLALWCEDGPAALLVEPGVIDNLFKTLHQPANGVLVRRRTNLEMREIQKRMLP